MQCQQGPIFECWNQAKRGGAATALRALWGGLEAMVPTERAWVAAVFADPSLATFAAASGAADII